MDRQLTMEHQHGQPDKNSRCHIVTVALRDGRLAYDGPSSRLTADMLRKLYGSASEELILPESTQNLKPTWTLFL